MKRCLCRVYSDNKLSYEELLEKENSVSVHHSNLQLSYGTESPPAFLAPMIWELVPNNIKSFYFRAAFKSATKNRNQLTQVIYAMYISQVRFV